MPLHPSVEALLAELASKLAGLGSCGDGFVREYRTHFESYYAVARELDVDEDVTAAKLIERFGTVDLIIAQEQSSLRRRLLVATLACSTRIACSFMLAVLLGAAILQRAPQDPLRGWEAVVLPEAVTFSLSTITTAFVVVILSGIAAVVLQYVPLVRTRFFDTSYWLQLAVLVAGPVTTGIMTLAAAVYAVALVAHHSSLLVSTVFSVGWVVGGCLIWVALHQIGSAVGQASRLRAFAPD